MTDVEARNKRISELEAKLKTERAEVARLKAELLEVKAMAHDALITGEAMEKEMS